MKSGDTDSVRLLFAAALAKSPGQRFVFLEGACGDDTALRARLEALLAAHEQSEKVLGAQAEATGPTMKLDFADAPDETVGQTLGRYKLLERVGEGGCGVVYVAEQTEPVRRRVALKVIKLGMDTRQVVARFEAERQALAMMDHPNIAKVLDAGTTETGRPFFVMELVRGIKITEYCDQANLSTRDRLDLFIKICQAIQHAHQKGIIHRDIKPSNILVMSHDGVPVPKVIDFGIAKATEGRLTDATVYTQLQQFIGTPAYMSPEQAEMSGLDIDTRSDIYSLGVLLYELLAGSTPFDAKELMASGIDVMRKTIREKEPVRPSAKLSQTLVGADVRRLNFKSSNRPSTEEEVKASSRRLLRIKEAISQLKGDLDWIIMKCLEKDRQRRYETANGLAADIRRHLDNEPITARPPSAAYRFQKAYRRNKLAFVAGAAVMAALVIGLGLAALGWHQTDLARKRALQAGAQAQAAQAEAEQERQRAKTGEARAKRLLYAADMNQAYQSLNESNLGRTRRLLNRHRPAPGEEDLRGWEWRYLWHLSRGDVLSVLANRSGSSCTAVRFSADGSRLAVGYDDGQPELWDIAHRVRLKQFESEAGWAQVGFSPRSNLLVTTAGPGIINLHDLSNGRESILWRGAGHIKTLSFTPDGSGLIALPIDPEGGPRAILFDLSRGVALSTNFTSGGGGHSGNARVSSDSKRLFLSPPGDPGLARVKCLDAETGREIWMADLGNDDAVSAMALSPNDKLLATTTCYEASAILILDTETGRLVARLEGHSGWVREVTFSRDGRWLASASADQTVRLWETAGWRERRVLRGHEAEVWSVDFSPDGKMLASGSKDGVTLLWDLDAATHQSTYGHRLLPPEVTYAGEFAPGKVYANVMDGQGLKEVTLQLDDLAQSTVPTPNLFNLARVLRLPNIFCVYDRTNTLSLWEIGEAATEVFRASVGTNVVLWEANSRPAFAYARGDHQVAWGEAPNIVHLASLDDPGRRWQWTSDLRQPAPRLFSPDGKWVVLQAAGPGPCLEVREVANGRLILRSDIPANFPKPYFADAGRKLVMALPGRGGMEVWFWDLEKPERPPTTFPERGYIKVLGVSPDGHWVAAPSEYGIAVLYDASTVKRLNVLQGTRHGVHSVAFSPDSRMLATGSSGQEAIQLWQVDTGQEMLTLSGKGSVLDTIAFTEGGDTLLAGAYGRLGTWQMWRAPSWEVIHAAEAREKAENKRP